MRETVITAVANKRILELKKLMSKASYRREKGLSVAEGLKLCKELQLQNIKPLEVYVTNKCYEHISPDFLSSADEVILITDEIAERVSDQKTPEGVFVLFSRKINTLPEYPKGRYIVLDRIQDIGNAGTIIRTADAFSIDGVIISPDSCDVFSPKGLRTSMGSVLRVNIYEENAVLAVSKLKDAGAAVFGTVLSENESDRLGNIQFPEFSAVVIGNEGNGISDEVLSLCSRQLTIPMSGNAESLNAAVAAGIIMFFMR